jgi:hypothetical protein
VLVGVALGFIVLAAAVAYALLPGGVLAPEDTDRVVLVLACPDADGVVLAQAVWVADTAAGRLEVLDPREQVTIAGTSFDTLADAYAFGGGAGVADAVERLTGRDEDGWIVFEGADLESALGLIATVTVEIERDANVFVGGTLHLFEAGTQDLGASEVCAYLAGVNDPAYRGDRLAAHLSLARGVADAAGSAAPGALAERFWSSSSLAGEEAAGFSNALDRAFGSGGVSVEVAH